MRHLFHNIIFVFMVNKENHIKYSKQNNADVLLSTANLMKDLIINDDTISNETKQKYLYLFLLYKSLHTSIVNNEKKKGTFIKKMFRLILLR